MCVCLVVFISNRCVWYRDTVDSSVIVTILYTFFVRIHAGENEIYSVEKNDPSQFIYLSIYERQGDTHID